MFGPLVALLAVAPAAVVPVALDSTPAGGPPAEVTVAWAAQHDGYRDVRLTWKQEGNFRTKITLIATNLNDVTVLGPFFVDPGGGDQFTLPGKAFRFSNPLDDRALKFVVQAVDAAGSPISDSGLSPVFDASVAPPPYVYSLNPVSGGRWEMSFRAGAPEFDDTPGDPLDSPADQGKVFQPEFATADQDELVPIGKPITATSFIIDRSGPGQVGVAAENGFGRGEGLTDLFGAQFTAVNIPSTATTGASMTMTGTLEQMYRDCYHPEHHCSEVIQPDASRYVELQSRTSASQPWKTIAKTPSSRGVQYGIFDFTIVSPGTREYRFYTAPIAGLYSGNARDGAASAAVLTNSAGGTGSGSGDGGLPITGAPTMPIAALGALLLAAGAGLTLLTRRRKSPTVG